MAVLVGTPSVERSLDASVKDGTAFAVMAGLGDPSYVGAGALLLGASDSAVALLVTLPVFLGSCTQVLSPWLIRRLGRRRPVFIGGSLLQAFSWPLMVAAFLVPREAGFPLLLTGFVLSFVGLHVGLPAWTSVMGDLVPPERRGRFFGSRNASCFVFQVAAMIVAGAGLYVFRGSGRETAGFIVLFGGAFLARLLSVHWLGRMEEPPYQEGAEDQFTFWQFIRRLPESNFARFVLFVGCLGGGAHFAGCLFIPYWRETLRFGYLEYMAVVSAVMLAQVAGLPFWGRIADRYGNRRVLGMTTVGIAMLPLLWLGSVHVVWAVLMQFWSGFFWSGFNQSMANFLLDAVSPPKRARCTAYLHVVLNSGVLVGGLLGSWAITRVPTEFGPLKLPYAFWTILILSFLFRSLAAALFLPRFKEVRAVPAAGPLEVLLSAREGSSPDLRKEPPRRTTRRSTRRR
jgi:MFS family permease